MGISSRPSAPPTTHHPPVDGETYQPGGDGLLLLPPPQPAGPKDTLTRPSSTARSAGHLITDGLYTDTPHHAVTGDHQRAGAGIHTHSIPTQTHVDVLAAAAAAAAAREYPFNWIPIPEEKDQHREDSPSYSMEPQDKQADVHVIGERGLWYLLVLW